MTDDRLENILARHRAKTAADERDAEEKREAEARVRAMRLQVEARWRERVVPLFDRVINTMNRALQEAGLELRPQARLGNLPAGSSDGLEVAIFPGNYEREQRFVVDLIYDGSIAIAYGNRSAFPTKTTMTTVEAITDDEVTEQLVDFLDANIVGPRA